MGIRGGDHLMEPGRKDECPRKKRTTKVGRCEGLNNVSHIFVEPCLMLGIFLHFSFVACEKLKGILLHP